MEKYDSIIIGSGINGISAAIYLQQKGLNTVIYEGSSTAGGSTKTEALTLPGFKHDTGSAIHPMAYASPFFKTLPLEKFGLEWVFPEIPYAHPFLDGSALAAYADVEETASQLETDKDSYLTLFSKITSNWEAISSDLLGPLTIPSHPFDFVRFGLKAIQSAEQLGEHYFENEKTRAFFYGAAAHSTLPMDVWASSSFGLVLSVMAHKYNWPFPKGGASFLVDALISYYESIGGRLILNHKVTDIKLLPQSRSFVFDLTPKQLLEIKNTALSSTYRDKLSNYNYGPGIFKVDWALDEPIPFTNEKCRKAGTIHIGYTPEEIKDSEALTHKGEISQTPYILIAQHTVFDKTRAPENKHTAWAYCHVPNGDTTDMTSVIEDQIEKAAPGFKKIILARSTKNTKQLERFNPNIIGGDINGGKQDITQLFTRPVVKVSPYKTSNDQVYICSSSTPPGGGVHGMCGFNAAKKVYNDHFKN